MKPFETKFRLTKQYLAESYDQSLPHGGSANTNFTFPAMLFAAGAGLLIFTDQPEIVGWVFVALCVLELVHIKFRRGWWLYRQTWGRNHDIEITLTIDGNKIVTRSPLNETAIYWDDVTNVIETDAGIILVVGDSGQHYLSKSVLDEEWMGWMLTEVGRDSRPGT